MMGVIVIRGLVVGLYVTAVGMEYGVGSCGRDGGWRRACWLGVREGSRWDVDR